MSCEFHTVLPASGQNMLHSGRCRRLSISQVQWGSLRSGVGSNEQMPWTMRRLQPLESDVRCRAAQQNASMQQWEVQRLLRRCLARCILQRVATADMTSPAHLGIHRVPCPAPPAAFTKLMQDVVADHRRIWRYLERESTSVQPIPVGHEGVLCHLTSSHHTHRLLDTAAADYFAALFTATASANNQQPHLPLVQLSRWDLFHGHIFVCSELQQAGILFHCKEYPAYDAKCFPYRLGHCQEGSPSAYSIHDMQHRNVLWFNGQLCFLSTALGAASEQLLWPETYELGTLFEEDFAGGATVPCVADVVCFLAIDGATHVCQEIVVDVHVPLESGSR